ncbi:unnamed protein product [Dracunculus medinensis]|uniref:protein-serine/threonine phosphatase n=1 Tax=Dracunculus medinensis TaxID=318479 RepID=A0A0N4UJN5_DRAME|nr:unnamed protein product [Dracunculus medinensis]
MQDVRFYLSTQVFKLISEIFFALIISVIQFYSGSEVAQYASTHLPGLLKERVSWKRGDYKEAIKEAFLEFDNLLRSKFFYTLNYLRKNLKENIAYGGPSSDTPGEDSGTTACLLLIFEDRVIVGNAGDSRAVLCRKGTAIELSVDHKPEDDLERRRIEAAGGEISIDGRVNGGLNLSRALGDHFYKKNEALPLEDQMISSNPDVNENKLEPDDEFVIVACDGIWNSLSSQEAVDFVRNRLSNGISLKEICEQMCDECLSPDTAGDGTGCDNMTVVIMQLLRKDW